MLKQKIEWVKLFESVTEPDKITVSSTDIPIDS